MPLPSKTPATDRINEIYCELRGHFKKRTWDKSGSELRIACEIIAIKKYLDELALERRKRGTREG